MAAARAWFSALPASTFFSAQAHCVLSASDVLASAALLCRHKFFQSLLVKHAPPVSASLACGLPDDGVRHVVLENTTAAAVQALVEFTATWRVDSVVRALDSPATRDSAADTVVELFELAARTVVDELRHVCEVVLAEQILDEENVCFLLQLADAHHTLFLREECFEFACFSAERICDTDQFRQLPPHLRDEISAAASRRRASRAELRNSSETVQQARQRAEQPALAGTSRSMHPQFMP